VKRRLGGGKLVMGYMVRKDEIRSIWEMVER